MPPVDSFGGEIECDGIADLPYLNAIRIGLCGPRQGDKRLRLGSPMSAASTTSDGRGERGEYKVVPGNAGHASISRNGCRIPRIAEVPGAGVFAHFLDQFRPETRVTMAIRRVAIEGLVLLASGLIGVADGLRLIVFKNRASVEDFTGPGRYLFVVSLLLALVGLLYLAFARRLPDIGDASAPQDSDSDRKLIAIVAVLGFYILLIGFVGYFWATQVFFLLILRVLGLTFGIRMVLISVAMGAGFYILFVRLFGMSLPRGMFFS